MVNSMRQLEKNVQASFGYVKKDLLMLNDSVSDLHDKIQHLSMNHAGLLEKIQRIESLVVKVEKKGKNVEQTVQRLKKKVKPKAKKKAKAKKKKVKPKAKKKAKPKAKKRVKRKKVMRTKTAKKKVIKKIPRPKKVIKTEEITYS